MSDLPIFQRFHIRRLAVSGARLAALAALLTIASPSTAFAQSTDTESREGEDPVARLLDVVGVLQSAGVTADQVVQQLREANPSIPAQVWTRYAQLVSDRATLLALYAPIYSRYLGESDVRAVLVFYSSVSGTHLLEALPRIAVETRQSSQQFAAEVALDFDNGGGESSAAHRGRESPAARRDTHAEQIDTLLRESGMLDQARAAMKDMLERLRKQGTAADVPPRFWDEATRRLTNEVDLLRLWSPAYQRHLSEADVRALIAFYRTPTGVRYVRAQAPIQKELVEAATALANRSARQAVREVLGPLPQWRLQNLPPEAR